MELSTAQKILFSLPALTGLAGGLFAGTVAGFNPVTLLGIGLLTLGGAVVSRYQLRDQQKNLETLKAQYEGEQHDQLTDFHAYINDLEKLILEVSPILLRQVRTSRIHTEQEITALTEQFAAMATILQEIISSSRNFNSIDLVGNLNELIDETTNALQFTLDALQQIKSTGQLIHHETQHLHAHMVELDTMTQQVKVSERQLNRLVNETFRDGTHDNQIKVIAVEISMLSRVLTTNIEKISNSAHNINATLKSVVELSTNHDNMNGKNVRATKDAMNKAFTQLKPLLTGYNNDVDMLKSRTAQIHHEISAALVAFQFQDRVNQLLEHIERNLACLDATVQLSHRQGKHRHAGMIDIEQTLQQMKLDYSMPEQHLNHQSDNAAVPKSANDDELTFF
jgi:methyl-accepting chemotaxis protein